MSNAALAAALARSVAGFKQWLEATPPYQLSLLSSSISAAMRSQAPKGSPQASPSPKGSPQGSPPQRTGSLAASPSSSPRSTRVAPGSEVPDAVTGGGNRLLHLLAQVSQCARRGTPPRRPCRPCRPCQSK